MVVVRTAVPVRHVRPAFTIAMELQHFLLTLLIIYVAAKGAGEIAVRLGQSAVLGELLAGILIGPSVLHLVHETETLKLLGEIGVILLLFEVGLESDLHAFLRVGPSAAVVASIGVAVPFALGYAVSVLLDLGHLPAIFMGATLMATSVAISARVLADLGRLHSREGQIILGAAVIDDILGLVILSVVADLAKTGTVSWVDIVRTTTLAVVFLVAAVVLGIRYSGLFSRVANRMHTRGALITLTLAFVLLLSSLAEAVGLASIVGAFAAGLVLARSEQHAHVEERTKPVAEVFVPIFFVLVGVAADLHYLNPMNAANWPVLGLAGGLLLAAVIGKFVAGWGVIGKGDRWVVGVGMLPRGEVGLIFAGIGLSSRIISDAEYGAILVVVVVTTLLAPVLLKWVLTARVSAS